MLKLNHKNLDVWKESLELVDLIYGLTSKLPNDERFGLISQIDSQINKVFAMLSNLIKSLK